MSTDQGKRLAVLISLSGDGGVERMVLNLCAEFAKHVKVDLLALKLSGGHADRIPDGVNLIRLKSRHSSTCVGEVTSYLKQQRPDVLLAAKDRAGRAALKAAKRYGGNLPVFIRLGTNLSAALARKSAFNRWLRLAPMRRLYPSVCGVIAVSEGVRQDTVATTRLAAERIRVIRNPVITPSFESQAQAPPPHDWLVERSWPVVMGMGRLNQQKDFPSLLRAFAAMQRQIPSRLILLGEGSDRADLMALAESLGIAARFHLAGFQSNPYAWLSRADLFVLSSAWEGSPNALTEALALGIPSVSTDCPSGPDEILDGGRVGPLVPVADAAGLARAMIQTLREPPDARMLKEAVDEYRAPTSARRYLQYMGLIEV
ncbi:MAG: glycosyltransferase [Panacagrimonas sp.]